MKAFILLVLSFVVFEAQAKEWVERGTVYGVGRTQTEAQMDLNKKLADPVIYLTDDYNTITGAKESGQFIKEPYEIEGDIKFEERTRFAKYNVVAFASVRGKKPFNSAKKSVKAYYDCKRSDKHPDAHLNLEDKNDFYINSQGEKKRCARVPGDDRVVSLMCTADKRFFDAITLDRDSGKMTASVFSPTHNNYEMAFESACTAVKGSNTGRNTSESMEKGVK